MKTGHGWYYAIIEWFARNHVAANLLMLMILAFVTIPERGPLQQIVAVSNPVAESGSFSIRGPASLIRMICFA